VKTNVAAVHWNLTADELGDVDRLAPVAKRPD
jgi:hypothetical protein